METTKATKKHRKSLALFILGYLFFFLVLVAGCVLIGVGYKNYVEYNNLFQTWLDNTGTTSGFSGYLATYNSNASANEWTTASIDLFAPGVALAAVGGIVIIILVIFNFKKSKTNA